MDLKKKAEALAARPYIVQVVLDSTTEDQPVYLALSPELEGCMGQGMTREEATENLRLARVDFIESLLEDGLAVPDPHTLTTATTSGPSATFTNLHKVDEFTRVKNHPDRYALAWLMGASVIS